MTRTAIMDSEALTALACRVEAAVGPDREIDLDIALAQRVEGCGYTDRRNDDGTFTKINIVAPRYTASLDAAMTLVPEGWDFSAGTAGNGIGGFSFMERFADRLELEVEAAAPALALTAAALRALAAKEQAHV